MNPKNQDKIYRYKRYGKAGSTEVIFFFCAMLTRLWQYRWLFWLMNRQGYTVYGYDVQERKIFENYSALEFATFVKSIREDVISHIDTEKTSGAIDFVAFGTSMGTIFALDCGKYIRDIKKVIINLTYGSIAHNVWHYKFHKPTKARLIQRGVITEKKMREDLGASETTHNLSALKDKQILVFSSKHDHVLDDTMKFKEAVSMAGLQATYYDSIFGHYLAGFTNLLRKKRWLAFLEK